MVRVLSSRSAHWFSMFMKGVGSDGCPRICSDPGGIKGPEVLAVASASASCRLLCASSRSKSGSSVTLSAPRLFFSGGRASESLGAREGGGAAALATAVVRVVSTILGCWCSPSESSRGMSGTLWPLLAIAGREESSILPEKRGI